MMIDAMPVLDGHTTFKEHLKALAILNRRLRKSNKVAIKLIANMPTMQSNADKIAKAHAQENEAFNRLLWKVVDDMLAMQGW